MVIEYDETESESDDDEAGECEWCDGMEEALVGQAQEFKAKGWNPEEDGPGYRYGMTKQCTECGRAFDLDPAEAAYAATAGPETPTGSHTDKVRQLAGDLGLDPDGVEKLFEVFSRRPMA